MLIDKPTAFDIWATNNQNRAYLQSEIGRFIREQFDSTSIKHKAESWIAIAKEQGFDELATEMESDLQTELLTA